MKRINPVLTADPVNRSTLQNKVYQRIVDLILSGAVEPGQTLTVANLALAFDVSPMPVREALGRLVSANVLEVVAGRSLGIPPLSLDHLEDLRRVRCEVEGVAATWAVFHFTRQDHNRLAGLVEVMAKAIRSEDNHAFVDANRSFHFGIYEKAGSNALMSVIEPLWLQVSPYFNILKGSANYSASNERHRDILDAFEKHDGSRVRVLIQTDINEAARYLRSELEAAARSEAPIGPISRRSKIPVGRPSPVHG